MSLLIFIAHTGRRLDVDPSAFGSVEEAQEWIAEQSDVPSARQVLMTGKGKIVKFQALFSEQEIFVYDRTLFTTSGRRPSAAETSPAPVPSYSEIANPPDTLSHEGSLDAWQELFKQRREWSQQVASRAASLRKDVLLYDDQNSNILRATAIAAERVKTNSSSLRSSISEAQKWAENVTHKPNLVLQNWDKTLRRMSSVKTDPELLKLFQAPGESDDSQKPASKALFGLISKPNANRAASRGKQAIKWLESELNDLENRFSALVHDGTALVDDLKSQSASLSGNVEHTVEDLTEEIETIVDKIEKDCDNMQDANEEPRSIAAVSKMALLHTRNLLPSLQDAIGDLSELLNKTVYRRNESSALAIRHMQRISAVETSFAELKSSITNLEISDDDERHALDMLTFIHQLPLLYGSLLIEAVRREEWSRKMRQDSSTLAEEMAVHKDEEERKRKKWSKSLDHYLIPGASDIKVIGMEISLTHLDSPEQSCTRSDIDAYISQLEQLGDCEEALVQLREAVQALDAPSKQQTKRANAFKNGSIHEASYGRSSLLLRGDDELIRTIQTEKSRLEDRLRGSESRVRKLEDLLHRQSQITRPAASSSLERQPSSPRLPHVSLSPRAEPLAFRPSVASSRRVSQNHSVEEKALVQRVLQLESELETERTRAIQAQQSFADQKKAHDLLLQQVQEAASMKRDLLDNFEAQQTEFDGERKLLLTDNRGLKVKIDELEEELDRVTGSQDTKALLGERNQSLEAEIESLRKDAAAEFETLQGHIKSLQDEQKERRSMLETKEKAHANEKKELQAQIARLREEIREVTEAQEEPFDTLQGTLKALASSTPVPEDKTELATILDSAARKLLDDLEIARDGLAKFETDNENLQSQIRINEQALQDLQQRAVKGESSAQELQDNLKGQQTQYKSLENQLQEERVELTRLRAQLSDGESGPEALRSRIEEEEAKVRALSQDVASKNSSIQRFEAQLTDRASRAEEISQILFRQTDGLTRLLEHVGFSVTRQDEGMVIQKISRGTKDSVLLSHYQSVERTPSGPVPTISASDPPDYIHWALAETEEEESQEYEAFVHESKAFDLDAFCEAITKRIKDTEHIARKWQREAKNYRDRFHRAQFDSQSKIAFRGFREGDLALFLPTRNQAPKRSWAAFNVGAPHYFLREQETHRLKSRDWLLARISKIEERVVDLGKKPADQSRLKPPGMEEGASEEENPFGLSDGLRWYYLDAAEERLGAPSTPGMGKSTVASAQVDAAGSIPRKDKPDDTAVTRTLAKSLDSRRSSGNSRKSLIGGTPALAAGESGGSNLRDVEHAETGDEAGPAQQAQASEDQNQGLVGQARSQLLAAQQSDGPSAESRPKSPLKSRAWDALWSFDLNLEGRGSRN